MGKKGGWFSAVKKALSPEAKEKKDSQRNHKSKKWFGKQKSPEAPTAAPSSREPNVSASVPPPLPPPAPQPVEEVKFNEVVEDDPEKHAYSVAIATAAAAEAAVAAAQAAAEVVRLTSTPQYVGKSKEEIAAIKIQTAFRGYLARRALRALRGLVRLKSLIEGQSVKKQATNTLKCMQTLARLQSQIRTRRIRMSEENQALQRQLQQKHEKELEKLKMGENWDISLQSKEQIEASLQSKQEAALRRERALAYAYSHQSRKNSKSTNATFMDPNNPHWGWSWLERWMAARPWEARSNSMHDKDFNDHSSVKSGATRTLSVVGDISVNSQRPSTSQRLGRPVSRHSPAAQSRGTTPSANPLRSSVGLTIWRLPGGGFAVGRFSGGRRGGERELPVVYTEMDGHGGFSNSHQSGGGGAAGVASGSISRRRVSWGGGRSGRSRKRGGLRRMVRNLFSCFRGGDQSHHHHNHGSDTTSSSSDSRVGVIQGASSPSMLSTASRRRGRDFDVDSGDGRW